MVKLSRLLRVGAWCIGSLVLALGLRMPAALAFSGSGAGTALNPYQITTCAQLEEINSNLSANYKLMNSVDCSGSLFTPIGSSFGGLTGTFDGGFHTISSVTISRPTDSDVGIFGFIEGGSVSNLNITDASVEGQSYVGVLVGGTNANGSIDHVTITNSNAMGEAFVGGLAGIVFQFSVSNSGTSNTTVSGTNNSGTTSWIGGFAGEINFADVSSSYVLGGGVAGNSDDPTQSQYVGGFVGDDGNNSNVSDVFSTADVTGHNYVGGLSGRINDTAYARTYASGNVSGDNYVGGLAGGLYGGVIDHSFSTGNVTGFTSGGLVGITNTGYGGDIITSAWDVTRSGQSDCVGDLEISITCTGVNVANIAPNYFMNNHTNSPINAWDFSSLWRTHAATYPTFQTVPAAPTNAHMTPSATSLLVTFGQAPDDGGNAITSYELEWGPTGGSSTDITGLSPATVSYTLDNLTPVTSYDIKLRATNAYGAGEWFSMTSSTLAATTTAPSPTQPAITSIAHHTVAASIDTSTTTPADETTPAINEPATTTTPEVIPRASTSTRTNNTAHTPNSSSFNIVWFLLVPGGIVVLGLGVLFVRRWL